MKKSNRKAFAALLCVCMTAGPAAAYKGVPETGPISNPVISPIPVVQVLGDWHDSFMSFSQWMPHAEPLLQPKLLRIRSLLSRLDLRKPDDLAVLNPLVQQVESLGDWAEGIKSQMADMDGLALEQKLKVIRDLDSALKTVGPVVGRSADEMADRLDSGKNPPADLSEALERLHSARQSQALLAKLSPYHASAAAAAGKATERIAELRRQHDDLLARRIRSEAAKLMAKAAPFDPTIPRAGASLVLLPMKGKDRKKLEEQAEILGGFSTALARKTQQGDAFPQPMTPEYAGEILRDSLERSMAKVVSSPGFLTLSEEARWKRFEGAFKSDLRSALREATGAKDSKSVDRLLSGDPAEIALNRLRAWERKYQAFERAALTELFPRHTLLPAIGPSRERDFSGFVPRQIAGRLVNGTIRMRGVILQGRRLVPATVVYHNRNGSPDIGKLTAAVGRGSATELYKDEAAGLARALRNYVLQAPRANALFLQMLEVVRAAAAFPAQPTPKQPGTSSQAAHSISGGDKS